MSWTPNNLERERLDKAQRLQERGVERYPRRAHRTHTTAQAIEAYTQAEAQDPDTANTLAVVVTGRIRRMNVKGKVSFAHIEDEYGRIQLFMRVNDMGEENYDLIREKLIEPDDFVQAEGTMMRTQAGEISVNTRKITLLSKAISPLPVIKQQVNDDGTITEYGEFSDPEARRRQRYVDLAVHEDVREAFRKRAKIIKVMRNFLDDEGMLEVETPILQPLYGGAAARPFVTYHNELKQDFYLRISFELYLKRLLVGGFDGVYEIGRDFRNEGVSFKHNPEFTMLEFYKAYIDYRGVMDIVERMLHTICEEALGTSRVVYEGNEIDFTPPFAKMTMREAIRHYTGIDYMDTPTAESLRAVVQARYDADAKAENRAPIRIKPNESWGRLIVEHLFSEYVEKKLIQPTFITDFPRDISPFAKRVEYDDLHVERFEIYVAGMEAGNAFTELNDPLDQQARFLEMAEMYRKGDDEETPLDEDYLRAMRYGMPPNGGFGMGVDRLVMILTGKSSIRDVLLYPHSRGEK
jgi:lysyl-tRNA synthetase class 2